MNKICPKCRRPQEDPSHLGCEKCKVAFVDEAELIANFTRDELKAIASFLLKDWRVYVIAGIILAIGAVLLYLPVRQNINGQIEKFQISASNRIASTYSETTNELASRFKVFANDAS